MAYIIVERLFDPPISDETLDKSGDKLIECLNMHGVQWVQSYVAADRKRGVCIYTAPDAEAVRTAHRKAGVVFERVWSAFAPYDDEVTPSD